MSLILFNLFIIVIYFFVTIDILSKLCFPIYFYLMKFSFKNPMIDKIKNTIAKFFIGLIIGYIIYYSTSVGSFYYNNIHSLAKFIEIFFSDPLKVIIKILFNTIVYMIIDTYLFHGKGLSKMLLDKNIK